jgi:hypothetical protein
MTEEEELLVEEVAGAHRPEPKGTLRYSPAWHDLDEAGRMRAHDLARALRRVESALDPEGVTSTAREVLARIARLGP